MNLPVHIREALERDKERQLAAAYEIENNLVRYSRKVVGEVAKLGEDQEFDESQLTILERDIRRFITSYRKCIQDSAVINQYLQTQAAENVTT